MNKFNFGSKGVLIAVSVCVLCIILPMVGFIFLITNDKPKDTKAKVPVPVYKPTPVSNVGLTLNLLNLGSKSGRLHNY